MSGYKAKLATLPAGEYYDCRDREVKTCEDPVEAVMDLLDAGHEEGVSLEAQVEELGDMEIVAYSHSTIDDAWFRRLTDTFIELAAESFDEEYGNCDEDSDCTPKVKKKRAEIDAAMRRVFSDIKPWRVHEVGRVTLTADDVLALVRDHAPEWLDPPGGAL